MGHILNKKDEWYLIKNNVDPFTRKRFEEGDSVVVCKKCRCVQLEDCWSINNACINCGKTDYTTVFTKDTVIPPVIKIPSKKKSGVSKTNHQDSTKDHTPPESHHTGRNYSTEVKGRMFGLGIVLPIIAILFYAFCFHYDFPIMVSPTRLEVGVIVFTAIMGLIYASMDNGPYYAANGSDAGAVMFFLAVFMVLVLAIWWIINRMFALDYAIEYYINKGILVCLIISNAWVGIDFYKDLKGRINSLLFKTICTIIICASIGCCIAYYYFNESLPYPIDRLLSNTYEDEYIDEEYIPEENVVYEIPNEYEYMMPYADSMVYSWDSLEGLDEDEVQFAINEIYAREGRIFLEEPYSSYFDGCSWYYGQYYADEFEETLFNEYEKDNIELLVEFAKSKGYR